MSTLWISLLIIAISGPVLWLLKPQRSHWFALLAALPPALVTGWQLLQLAPAAQGQQLFVSLPWAPSLGLEISLRLDSLAIFFGLIVTGIGTCIAFYTNYYFEDDPRQGFFYLLLFSFMASMLGLVWANDLLSLFVFWEGTSITSYLLIAFKTGDKSAVEGARRALIVTTAGGLAMLAGLLLLGQAAGTFRIDELLAQPHLTALPVFPVALTLLLLGAFTKSAQWPFHFWLPGAMAAPTPASAYLHSATMVKAGIYLLARMQPGMGDSPLWFWPVLMIGSITMVLGAVSALRYTDMKAILAYTTISALGTMTMLLAFPGEEAALAVTVTILAHALYKAPLFLMAGIVDHAMGTRDLRALAGLWRGLPWVAAVALLGALSMAGVPPTWGFLAKELLLEEFYHLATHNEQIVGGLGFAAAVVMAVFSAGAIFGLVWEAFLRRRADDREPAHLHHAPSFWFVAPALLLTLIGAFTALFIGQIQTIVTAPAAVIAGAPIDVTIKLWYGWTPVLITSLAILAVSIAIAGSRRFLRNTLNRAPARLNGVYVYDAIIDAIYGFAYRLTRIVQGGPMAPQISVTLLAGVLVLAYALLQVDVSKLGMLESNELPLAPEFLIFVVAIVAAVTTVRARSRLSAIISLGVVGVAVTLFYVFYSAPDLALTQLLIEVLTVILLILVFFRVKPDTRVFEPNRRRYLRFGVAIAMGLFGAGVVLVNHFFQVGPSINPYFLANALPIGQGGNVVNVILVDIRGYDTLGEITVLALAALGGFAVLRSPKLHALRRRINRLRRRPAGDFQPAPPPLSPPSIGGPGGHLEVGND